MKIKHLLQLFVAISVIGSVLFTSVPVSASSTPATGLKAPFAQGIAHTVTGTHDRAGGRHALDFGMYLESVVAMKAGTIVRTAWESGGGGNMLFMDNGDYCTAYLHLNKYYVTSGYVAQGTTIAQSGNTDGSSWHLHVAAYIKRDARCSYNHSDEMPMIFDEVGRELNYNESLTSQNSSNPNPIIPFGSNAHARQFFDQGTARANLEVCADNLAGQQLYVKFWRDGRSWDRTETASGICHTFGDLDGPGSFFTDVPYRASVSIGNWPDTSWPVNCLYSTNRMGLCTQAQYPNEAKDPIGDPVLSFINGISTLRVDNQGATLQVCDTGNLAGKVVYWQMWRSDQSYEGQGTASGDCISFTMNGSDPIQPNIPYYSVASLNPIAPDQAKLQRASCAGTTGGKQLCDTKIYDPGSVCQYGKEVGTAFFEGVADNLNAQTEYPITDKAFAVQAMQIWQRYEGTNACWNPLATTWYMAGSSDFNSQSVKNYLTQEDGVRATGNTLGTTNAYQQSYAAIRKMLGRQGFDEAGLVMGLDTYSGSGGYISNLMNEWRTLYNSYTGLGAVSISIPGGQIQVGVNSNATVQLTQVPGSGYTSSEFTCSYDPTILQINNIAEAGLFGSDAVIAINGPQNGSFILAIAGTNNKRATTGGAAFTFGVNGLKSGNTAIECKAKVSNGSNNLTVLSPAVMSNIPVVGSSQQGTVTGQVIAGKPVSILIKNGDSSISNSVNTQPDGTFTLTVPAGTYTLTATAEGYLSASTRDPDPVAITVTNAGTINMPRIDLRAGDITGDNVVNQFDALTIGMNYNLSAPAAADLNNDGVINVLDLEMVAKNYRATGPADWQ